MKVFFASFCVFITLLVWINTNAQDIIYTISGEIESQKTSLDSIAVENLSKQSIAGFGNLPERDDYRINLSRDEYWGSTSVNDMLNQSGLQIIKNLPGNMVVGYRGQKTIYANISLHNNNGQRLAFKENQVLENGTLVEVEIGNAGIYFLTISSPEETRSFKATGMLAAGNISIATQSGAPIPLKSGQAYTLAGTGTEKGDNVKVSVFKLGYLAQPIELVADDNETLVFPLEAQTPPEVETLEVTNILSNSVTLNGNVISDGNSPITERGFYWSATNENPGEADSIIVVEGTTGSFSAELSGLELNTSYYVRAFVINEIGTSYGETVSFTTNATLPSVVTTAITNITQTTATSGGNVTSDGGVDVTERGICWNTTGNPSIADSKTTNGTGDGNWVSELSGLQTNTTYYVCAYAANSQGIAYGEQISFITRGIFTDTRDGAVYEYITIGNQVWMAENLKYLPSVTNPSRGSSITAYYYVYGYDGRNIYDAKATLNYTTYGVLYNWSAAVAGFVSSTDKPSKIQGVCPAGWHLPSRNEWVELCNYLESNSAGGKLKESGTVHWTEPNNGATNETGFTALPGGCREFNMVFKAIGNTGHWWSSSGGVVDKDIAWCLRMDYNVVSAGDHNYYLKKHFGFSVRCIKD